MSRDQLAEAIRGPAEVFGATVEPALVTQLLKDAGANSDQLPLVQHVLARIWRIWQGGPQDGHSPTPEAPAIVLRLKDYQDRGGLIGFSAAASATPDATAGIGVSDSRSGLGPGYLNRQNALSEHANEAYLELGDSQPESRISGPDHKPSHKQVIAQMLFRCLAERGPSGQFVRRPVKVRDVAAVAGCAVDEVIEVAEVFRREDRSFLVPPVGVTLTADSVLDISHEALIRQWQRFGGQSQQSGEHESAGSWLEIEEQSRRRYRRLVEASENEPTAGLLRNPELEFLNLWWEDFRPSPAWANACVKESFDRTHSFLKRSLTQAAADKTAAEADQQERITTAEATARTMTRRSILISVVALVSVGLAIVAWRAQVEASYQKKVAVDARNEPATQATLATDQARASKVATKTAEKQRNRADGLVYGNTLNLALSEWDEGHVAMAWDYLNAAQWNRRGWEHDYLFTRFNQNQTTLRGHTGFVSSVAFNADGERIVSGSAYKTVKLWDAASGQETLTLKTGPVSSVAFSADGTRIVSGSDQTVNVWDVASGHETLTLKGHTNFVFSVAFSMDGTRIVSGSEDKTVKVWMLASRR